MVEGVVGRLARGLDWVAGNAAERGLRAKIFSHGTRFCVTGLQPQISENQIQRTSLLVSPCCKCKKNAFRYLCTFANTYVLHIFLRPAARSTASRQATERKWGMLQRLHGHRGSTRVAAPENFIVVIIYENRRIQFFPVISHSYELLQKCDAWARNRACAAQ